MPVSNHIRRSLAPARFLAVPAVIVALAVTAATVSHLIGGKAGAAAGAVLILAVFAGCGLVFRARAYFPAGLPRPAEARLPRPVADVDPFGEEAERLAA